MSTESKALYNKALATKLGVSVEQLQEALEATKAPKREWRKYYIYLTPAQLEALRKAMPTVQVKVANPGSGS